MSVDTTTGAVKVTGKVKDLVNIVKAIIDNKFYCRIHTYIEGNQEYPKVVTLTSSLDTSNLWSSGENGELVAVLVIYTGGLISGVDLSNWIKSFGDCAMNDDFVSNDLPGNKMDEDNVVGSNYQMTIGKLVDNLKHFHEDTLVVIKLPNGDIVTPLGITSWRGEYRRPALCYFDNITTFNNTKQPLSTTTSPIGTVGRLLSDIKFGLTQTHYGWKGGEFRFSEQMVLLFSNERLADCVVANKITFDEELCSVVIFTERLDYLDLIG